MKILFTGRFDPEYNRTKIIIKGLKDNGAEVSVHPYPRKNKCDRKLLMDQARDADWIFLPSFTHTDVPFIKRLTKKPIIFDPLISRYLSKVFDYKAVWKYSPRAYKNYLKDARSLRRSDLIITDTGMHKKYFMRKFGVDEKKMEVVPVGVITEDFFPVPHAVNRDQNLVIGFYGSFIPLHGIEVILEAASLLQNERNLLFRISGEGILYDKMKKIADEKKLNNLEFTGYIPYKSLNREINSYDIALGIFGNSLKARLVIPNKIFHYCACNKPVITMESDGIKEIFTHGTNIHLTKADDKSLARAILELSDPDYRRRLGENAGELIRSEFNEKKTGERILRFLYRKN